MLTGKENTPGMPPFTKILVANRGEIAVRICRTLRELDIASVAIYSEADRGSLHAAFADEAYLVGAGTPSESYLNQERILDAARRSGAEAVHPGYGFLAENADFARADYVRRLGDEIGWPIAIKASAGGGGKGLKVVGSPEEVDRALEAARREGQA